MSYKAFSFGEASAMCGLMDCSMASALSGWVAHSEYAVCSSSLMCDEHEQNVMAHHKTTNIILWNLYFVRILLGIVFDFVSSVVKNSYYSRKKLECNRYRLFI